MSNLKKLILLAVLFLFVRNANAQNANITKESFAIVNMQYPGLQKVAKAFNSKNYELAAKELLQYYRSRRNVKNLNYNVDDRSKYIGKKLSKTTMKIANNALLHKFKPHKSYPFFDYGKDINWQYKPVADNLIRTFLHRTNWFEQLGLAYWSTGDEKYAKEWKYEVNDWIIKNKLGAYPDDKDFAWKAFVVSFRLNNWSGNFNMFINSPNFTPAFLMEFLNSYNQQADYVMAHYTDIGNHRLFESVHMLYAGSNFPELNRANEWRKSGIAVLNGEIQKQVFPDGMQYELSTTYHIGSINIFVDALKMGQLCGFEQEFPSSYRQLVEKMMMAVVNFSFPDYTFPLFGDSFLAKKSSMIKEYAEWAKLFPNNQIIKYFATEGKMGTKPDYLSKALPYAGFYTFRNGWNKKSTVMVLKAGPPAFFHAQPDNGTFDLWIKGRDFTPDAGSYDYDTSTGQRQWFRQTRVHCTLTLNNENMVITKAKQTKWTTCKNLDILTYTNPSYAHLNHQRSVLFINQKYFLIIDKAVGTDTGELGEHFVLKEDSKPIFDKENNKVYTTYTDGNNLLFQCLNTDKVSLKEETGKVSYQYQKEVSRPAFVFEKPKPDSKTQYFVSVLYPFENGKVPEISMKENVGNNFEKGALNLTLSIDGKTSDIITHL